MVGQSTEGKGETEGKGGRGPRRHNGAGPRSMTGALVHPKESGKEATEGV